MFGNDKSHKFHPLKGLVMIVVFLGFITIASYVVMFLWNTILTDVTNVKPLNFWQAAGLLVLTKILFGGFGGRNRERWKGSKAMRDKWKNMTHDERKEWKDKWMNMNKDERQEAKERWKEYCKKKKTE
ncbi:MAG: hypothetical protein AB8G11_11675 [Saprospiraceae bacterium]